MRDSSANTAPLLESPEEEESRQGIISSEPRLDDSPSCIALAFAPTTPHFFRYVLPFLTLIAHALFLYGQLAPMWHIWVYSDVSVWANATSTKSKWALDSLGVDRQQHWESHENTIVQTYTFAHSVTELWSDTPGKLFARFTAVLLILCSGIWPHLKLFMLQGVFFWKKRQVPLTQPQRKRPSRQHILQFLSILGKWSLADVLVVTVFIAVLQLEWSIDPAQIKQGLGKHLPVLIAWTKASYSDHHLCSKLLGLHCLKAKNIRHVTQCKACIALVSEAYEHPSWAQTTGQSILDGIETSGGGPVQLSIVGMRGIYAFCVAVVLSIALSCVVDVLHVWDINATEKQAQQQQQEELLRDESNQRGDAEEDSSQQREGVHSQVLVVSATSKRNRMERLTSLSTSIVTFAVVLCALYTPVMVRTARGAIPQLMQDILGMQWTRSYSIHDLVANASASGSSGSGDWLLLTALAIFVFIGPVLRALLCLLQAMRPRPSLALVIDWMGAFCAWEVLVLAVWNVHHLLPNVTGYIFWMPHCWAISKDDVCFEVDLDANKWFGVVLLGGSLLVTSAWFCTRGSVSSEVPVEPASSMEYRSLLNDGADENDQIL